MAADCRAPGRLLQSVKWLRAQATACDTSRDLPLFVVPWGRWDKDGHHRTVKTSADRPTLTDNRVQKGIILQ